MPIVFHPHYRRGRSAVVVLLGLLVVAGGAIGLFLLFKNGGEHPPRKNDEQPPITATLSKAECSRLMELRNLGIGYLENERFGDAGKALAELAEKLPDDPIGSRNLLIAMILSQGTTAAVSGDAERLIARLKVLEPDSFVPQVLAARWAKATKNENLAIAELSRAVERAGNDLPTLYEFYEESKVSADPTVREQGQAALKRARAGHPENLYVLTEWMPIQAAARDPGIVDSLISARELIQPIMQTVAAGPQRAAPEYIDKALEAVAKQDWRQVLQFLAFFRNVIRPTEWVQSDLRRTQRHALAYVIHEFRRFECAESELREPASPPIDVTFSRAPETVQPPPLPEVRGVHLADFDLDGRLDLIALSEARMVVLGRSSAGQWRELSAIELPAPLSGLIAADLDRDQPGAAHAPAAKPAAILNATDRNEQPGETPGACQDADLDIVAFGPAGVRVLRNDLQEDGTRKLSPVPQEAAFDALRDVLAAVFGDLDHDGDLDLVLSSAGGISVWLNRGDLRFYEATQRSTLPPATLRATSLLTVDWNRDLTLDVVVSGPADEPAGYLENLRHGQLRWRPFEGPLAELAASESLALLDHDANGSWDLLGSGAHGTKLVTTKTDSGIVTGTASVAVSETAAGKSLLLDFDNDSHLDLLTWSDKGIALYRATPAGTFELSTELVSSPPQSVNDCRAGDIDSDGDSDLVFAAGDALVLFTNEGGNQNHWVDLRIRARPDHTSGRVNHLGIGGIAELKGGPLYREQVITGQVTHFGLGARDAVDVVRILWTNGVPQNAFPKQANISVCEEQFPTGSCPFLYTWTGEKFEFFTDLLWNAPLGLQLAEGVVARPREWEYLLIPGERLVPRDGRYSLQITEELWEAGYFDHVQLIAVDHPADVAMYSNEKVGPAELAEFKIHTVRQPRPPVAARDADGRDVLNKIARHDGIYMKGFSGPPRRGYVGEHFLELDLGRLESPRQIMLFLTGWLYPTPTSVNIGVSQNPDFGQPRPPALWVPDAQGEWKEIRPFMGFPGGKTKTIAIDLTDAFPAADYRLRIVTNQELYWDEAFFTVDEKPASMKLTRLDAAAANLHYRGFSARRLVPDFGPDVYDYAEVSAAPAWKAMSGRFTRYGDVTELLAAEDDRLVVLGAGDEMTVHFAVPDEPPPSGWKRDFLLYNVGWDKDADLNVIYGQSSEPLPFRGMSGYPYRGDEAAPDTPEYREYLKTYQTREQPHRGFWSQLRNSPQTESRPAHK